MAEASSLITVLCGGVGAARFLRGLVEVVRPASIRAIVNIADDTELHGLHISPDIDTVTYTLADEIDPDRGWGLRNETWQAMNTLGTLGDGAWFSLGDRDLGTHLHRTGQLKAGRSLSDITAQVASALDIEVAILPVSDDRVETRVQLHDASWIGFQEYFVGKQHDVEITAVDFVGIADAQPTQAVMKALEEADVVVLAPSNPIVSLGPVLAVQGIRSALRNREGPTVAISPIIAGEALKGPAARMLEELGHPATAVGVASMYADFIDGFVLDDADAASCGAVRSLGVVPSVTNTVMARPNGAPLLASHVVSFGQALGGKHGS